MAQFLRLFQGGYLLEPKEQARSMRTYTLHSKRAHISILPLKEDYESFLESWTRKSVGEKP
jgi:hypothetical protein